MPSFAEEARARSVWRARVKCLTGSFLDSLPDVQRADVCEALADKSIKLAAIMHVLTSRYGAARVPSLGSVQRHRAAVLGGSGCKCE